MCECSQFRNRIQISFSTSIQITRCKLIFIQLLKRFEFVTMSEAGQRRRWDHLIGRHYEEAREEIKRDKPDAVIETVPHVSDTTLCCHTN
jgi:hypothetical protein